MSTEKQGRVDARDESSREAHDGPVIFIRRGPGCNLRRWGAMKQLDVRIFGVREVEQTAARNIL